MLSAVRDDTIRRYESSRSRFPWGTIMTFLTRCLLTSAVSAILASASYAQTTTANTGTTTGTTGTGTGTTSNMSTSAGGTPTIQQDAIPTISLDGATGSSLSRSNILGIYYANPLYQGNSPTTTVGPGGFGTPTFGASGSGSTTGGSTRTSGINTGTASNTGRTTTTGMTGTNAAAGRTGTTATAGATNRTGTTGTNRNTSFNSNSNFTGGEVIPLQRAISYTATLRFISPAIVPAQMQADLQTVIGRSSMIANPGAITISMEGPIVILRGNVKDEDEARTAEGMIRLSPGVKQVRNELKFQ